MTTKSAQRIREAREYLGFTQQEVADYLGLHRPSVSEIEAGRRRVQQDELAKLSKLLCRSQAYLSGEEESPPLILPAGLEEAAKTLPPEDVQELCQFAEFLRHRKANKQNRKAQEDRSMSNWQKDMPQKEGWFWAVFLTEDKQDVWVIEPVKVVLITVPTNHYEAFQAGSEIEISPDHILCWSTENLRNQIPPGYRKFFDS